MNPLLVNLYKACHLDIHETNIKDHFDLLPEHRLDQWWKHIDIVVANRWTSFACQLFGMTEVDLAKTILTAAYSFSWTILKPNNISTFTVVGVINPFYECNTLEEANIKLDMEIPENGIPITAYSKIFSL